MIGKSKVGDRVGMYNCIIIGSIKYNIGNRAIGIIPFILDLNCWCKIIELSINVLVNSISTEEEENTM